MYWQWYLVSLFLGLYPYVSFTSQAPHANWDHTHEEACEEAAILIANRYFQNREFEGAGDAEADLNPSNSACESFFRGMPANPVSVSKLFKSYFL